MNECCARVERVHNVDVAFMGQEYGGRGWCGKYKLHVPRELDVTHRDQQPARESDNK